MNTQLSLTKTAFWDTNLDDIDMLKHEAFIITRVFQFGLLIDIKEVLSKFNSNQIIAAFKNTRGVDSKAIHLTALILNINETELQ